MFTERELKNTYRLKKFREYYETAKIAFCREWGDVPRLGHTSPERGSSRLDSMPPNWRTGSDLGGAIFRYDFQNLTPAGSGQAF